VMTPNPECVLLSTPVVDALHTMHDGRFLHLPVVDPDGNCVACVDVLQLTQGAMSSAAAASGSESGDAMGQLMQRFWDSALALPPADTEEDTASVRSSDMSDQVRPSGSRRRGGGASAGAAPGGAGAAAAGAGAGGAGAGAGMGAGMGGVGGGGAIGMVGGLGEDLFSFKLEDRRGRVHRFTAGSESMTELVCAVASRLGGDYDPDNPPSILYADEDNDMVVISTDEDLHAAVKFAKATGIK
ncbi:unnamed protein product, partial [Closterium sp. NIES-54]